MEGSRYILAYLMAVTLQVLLCNYANISPMVMLSILPMLILFLPTRCGHIAGMLAAFGIGLAVDFFADGILGLNAIALTPVAYFRPTIIRRIFGDEILARKENLSPKRAGLQKTILAIAISQALFLVVYVWVDSAGTRSFSFNLARFSFSLLSGVILNYILSGMLSFDDRQKRWK